MNTAKPDRDDMFINDYVFQKLSVLVSMPKQRRLLPFSKREV